MEKIESLRYQIDGIDDDIILLLDKRIEISNNIGKIKKENIINILCSKRENEILERLITNIKNLLKDDLVYIYRNIFEISKKYQK